MAVLGISTNDATVKKQWDELKFREVRKEMFVNKFMGKSADSLIYEKTDLSKNEGDQMTFTLFPRQSTEVIKGSSGTSLEGKEGTINWFTDKVTLEEYKMGFRYKTGLDEHRPWFSVSDENAIALDQVSSEYMDDLWFEKMTATPTKIFYGGGKANAGLLAAADKLTPALLRRMSAMARAGFPSLAATGNKRTMYPFKPIRVGGKGYFILVVHPYATYDLKNNTEYQGYLINARERSKDNPIFSGALAIIDDVVVHEHENIEVALGGTGSDIPYCKGIFAGAGSAIWAWGHRPVTIDKSFGYDEERGIGRKFIAGVKKTQFKFEVGGSDLDFGSCGAYFTVTDLAVAQ